MPKYKCGPKSRTRPRAKSSEDENEEFVSPPRDENQTDYGLEFTNQSNAQKTAEPHATPRVSRLSSGESDEPQGTPRVLQPTVERRNTERAAEPQGTPRALRSSSRSVESHILQPTAAAEQRQRQRNRKVAKPISREDRFVLEVGRLQRQLTPLIQIAPFLRLVRELIFANSTEVTRITKEAFEALQGATEMYMTQRFQDAYMLTLHRGRVTLTVADMRLINFLRSD